jgi:hypothetical protein
MATVFENPREPFCRAAQTVAIPPCAMGSKSSYRPRVIPGVSFSFVLIEVAG